MMAVNKLGDFEDRYGPVTVRLAGQTFCIQKPENRLLGGLDYENYQ